MAPKKPHTPQKTKPRAKATAPRKRPARDKRDDFIRLYLIHKNASQAYREAGYQATTSVRQNAHALLSSPYVKDRLDDAREMHLAALDVRVEDVFDRFRAIAFGDTAAITEYVTSACRYCHGFGHAYHWRTQRELDAAVAEAVKESDRSGKKAVWPDSSGGFGYTSNLLPHPDCPECDGDGRARVVFKNTRLMTPDERKLFAGVKQTQHGIEFKFNDQIAALKELAENLQFYRARDETNANAVARLIAELQERGGVGRMPLRKDNPKGDQT